MSNLMSFSGSAWTLYGALFVLEKWLLFCLPYPVPPLASAPVRPVGKWEQGEGGGRRMRGGVHSVWTNGQPEQDMEVYSLWVCRFGWGTASTHTHTIVGVFPLEGKVSLPPTHLFSLFFHPSSPLPFLPLDLFLLHPSFLLVSQTAPPTFERREKRKC